MSYDHVKDRTSAAVGSEEDGGVLFDETIAAYSARRKRAEEFLSEALIESQRKAFRAYLQRAHWTTIVDDPSAIDSAMLAVTAELDEPLRVRFFSCPGLLLANRHRFSSAISTFYPRPSERPSCVASGATLSSD